MYFSKKYWNIIFYLYKLNHINLSYMYFLGKESCSYLPLVLKKIKFTILYNGQKDYILNFKSTNFLLKKLL